MDDGGVRARRRGTECQRTARNSGVQDQSLGGGPVRRLPSAVAASNTTNMQTAPRAGHDDGRGRVACEFGGNGDSWNGCLPRRAASYRTVGGVQDRRTNQYSERAGGWDGNEYQAYASFLLPPYAPWALRALFPRSERRPSARGPSHPDSKATDHRSGSSWASGAGSLCRRRSRGRRRPVLRQLCR